MNFITRLFTVRKVVCPRCLGKGNVDLEDIKRLNRELYWVPGKCAYCNGTGKVSPKIAATIRADMSYLTTDTPANERKRLLNKDEAALQRAQKHKEEVDKFIKQVEHLYYIENLEPDKIAEYFLDKYKKSEITSTEKQEFIAYIEKVIKSKLPNK